VARKTADRKRRTRAHLIANLAVNYLDRHVLLASCTLERIVHDYGLDFILFAYDEQGWVEPGQILLQVKAAERLRRLQDGRTLAFRIDHRHLNSWLLEPSPVVLIVYEASTNRAWWLHVQGAFAREGGARQPMGETVSLRIPVKQVVTPKSVRRFVGLRIRLFAPNLRLVVPDEED
jgi:hypothetical protein